MDRLLSDDGIETRATPMSWCRSQFQDDRGFTEPATDEGEEDSNPWGAAGYLEALEAVVESWHPDTGRENRIRYWVETRLVPP